MGPAGLREEGGSLKRVAEQTISERCERGEEEEEGCADRTLNYGRSRVQHGAQRQREPRPSIRT